MLFDIDFIKKINEKIIGRIWRRLFRITVSRDVDGLNAALVGMCKFSCLKTDIHFF